MRQAPRRARTGALARWVTALSIAHLGAVALAWLAIGFGDRSWPATLLLFGPRWALAIPLAALAPAALAVRSARALAVQAAAAALAAWPLMGLCLSPKGLGDALGPDASPGRDLRIMSHNLGGRLVRPTSPALLSVLERVRPDVVALQECIPAEEGVLAIEGWHAHAEDQICLLSRFPIRRVDARDRKDVWDRGGSGAIVRYEIETPRGIVDVVDVHLETVREGLSALRHRDLGEFEENLRERRWESSLARAWTRRAAGPVLVAGDFNMPVESAIYREEWGELANAFGEAGLGWGWTKRSRWLGVRIDHVLASPELECLGAWVGPETGSDHLPIIADYRLR